MMFRRMPLFLAALLTTVLLAPVCFSETETERARTLADVLRDAEKTGAWNVAYEKLYRSLAPFNKRDAWSVEEYQLLGLSRQQVDSWCASLGYSLDRKSESASFGCGRGGGGFEIKYRNGKAVAVRSSGYILDLAWNGPWIRSKRDGLRRAEWNVSSEIETSLKNPNRDSDALASLYRNRAKLRNELGEPEYATKDLAEACQLLLKNAAGGSAAESK